MKKKYNIKALLQCEEELKRIKAQKAKNQLGAFVLLGALGTWGR